jgi:hypothetical protein
MADYTVTVANLLPSAQGVYLQGSSMPPIPGLMPLAGAAITRGQPVYQDPTDNSIKLADANGADPLFRAIGIAANDAGIGQPINVVISDPQFTPGFTAAIGDIVIVSANVGKLCPYADKASGSCVSFMMIFYSTTQADFKIVRSDVAIP